MNIVIIQPNMKMKDTAPYLNHGMAYVAAVLEEEGCRVHLSLVDEFAWRRRTYLTEIERLSPVAVFVTAFSNQWDYVKRIAGAIKQKHNMPIVCGGPHVTLFPEALAESRDIDAVVVGEGEIAVRNIVAALRSGSDWHDIRGAWTHGIDGGISRNGVAPRVENLDDLPFPAYHIYERKIVLRYPGITFSRGCPFDCSYCCNRAYSRLYPGKRVRNLSPRRAIDLTRCYQERFDPGYFNIDDDTFTKNPVWLRAFLELYANEIHLPFNCNARPETVTTEVAALLKRAGCRIVSLGIESGNEVLRKRVLNRHMTNAAILEAGQVLQRSGLELSTFNMVGLPGESIAEFRETVEINRDLRPEKTQISVYYPYRGTELGDSCYEQGAVDTRRHSESYFGSSILRLEGFPRWRIAVAYRLFKFNVYGAYDRRRALLELVKDLVKAVPGSQLLLAPYLWLKRALVNLGAS